MKNWGYLLFLIFVILFTDQAPLQAEDLTTVQEHLFHGKKNDYSVFAQGSKRIFVLIREISSNTVWLEFTEIPFLNYQDKKLLEQNPSWKHTIHQLTSPQETFLVKISKQEAFKLFLLDPKTKQWSPVTIDQAPKLLHLLNIPLTAASPTQLKKYNNNQLWRPKLSCEGENFSYQTINAYSTAWPQDGSFLAGNCILVYFTSANISALPIWVSIDTFKGPVIIRTIDVGHQAISSIPLPPSWSSQ